MDNNIRYILDDGFRDSVLDFQRNTTMAQVAATRKLSAIRKRVEKHDKADVELAGRVVKLENDVAEIKSNVKAILDTLLGWQAVLN